MRRFARGSEWRKWDLHVHPPSTKLSDGYALKEGKPDWERFCKIIHDSDVEAIGITDYFSLDGFYTFKENFERLYPASEKIFFPNLELRLNETVNKASEVVDFHIIFPPNLSRDEASEFLANLKSQLTDSKDKHKTCAHLSSRSDFEKASVSRKDIKGAIDDTFGEKIARTDYLLLIAAANNNGFRADTKSQRKVGLADEIDKFVDGVFGNPKNTAYFLDIDRLEAVDQKAALMPVFSGCDAHNFDDLENWLGAEVTGDNNKHITWIKADLTFEGLQQTFIEPSERVKLQASVPDKKEPYKVISKILFEGSEDFPSEVVFNPGLNAIIGSRSSGKSALLAYIAHAVNPEYTVRQQIESSGMNERDVGPGASITWAAVSNINYSVEWVATEAKTGQVIYIPQNSLYAISTRPDDITSKIKPAVFRRDPDFAAKYHKTLADIENRNKSIRTAISGWFDLSEDFREVTEDIRGLGDRKAITARQTELTGQIQILREASSLSANELTLYEQLISDSGNKETRIEEITQEQRVLGQYVGLDENKNYQVTEHVEVEVNMIPSPSDLPSGLEEVIQTLLESARGPLLENVKANFVNYCTALNKEHQDLLEAIQKLRNENQELLQKSAANVKIDGLVKDLKNQKSVLAEIEKKEDVKKGISGKQEKLINSISGDIEGQELLLNTLAQKFNESHHMLEDMMFSIEVEYNPDVFNRISRGFNKTASSKYLDDTKQIDIAKILSEPGEFIEQMNTGKLKINQGEDAKLLTLEVLTAMKEVRFVASLEGDRIGGFRKSSMTPGKQALFALTLILAESDEPWPLLIDQPEDDLDSRSVCEVIINDLVKRKRERQVIMVSHNANLVVGADSEEIIVANRHGDDRPNRDDMMFAYLSGSLEHSQPKSTDAKFILDSAGIREHACEILDGGSDAFQKRKDKYRI